MAERSIEKYNFLAPFRHCFLVFVAETKRLATYRAQFWFELILSSAIELVIAVSVWRAVFSSGSGHKIGDYSFEFMVLYLTVAIFFGQATKGTGVGTFQREVYEGSLTKYLIYPLSVYSYKFGTFAPRGLFAILQLCVALCLIKIFGIWPQDFVFNPVWVVAGIVSLFFSCLLYFFLIIFVECLSFWVDNVWALSYALQIGIVFLSGKAIPLDLFPSWASKLMEISPFAFLAYFPARVFLGQFSFERFLVGFIMLVSWVFIFFLLSRIYMRKGLKRYTGVGQ